MKRPRVIHIDRYDLAIQRCTDTASQIAHEYRLAQELYRYHRMIPMPEHVRQDFERRRASVRRRLVGLATAARLYV